MMPVFQAELERVSVQFRTRTVYAPLSAIMGNLIPSKWASPVAIPVICISVSLLLEMPTRSRVPF